MSSGNSAANPARATIGVVGLGSIGGVIAGCLRAADQHDVIACVKRPLERLALERPDGTIEVPIRALTDPADARPLDWVLLCTESQDTPSSARGLRQLCGPRTRVAVLQNGIGHVDRLAPLVGEAPVGPTIVYFNGERRGPGRVRLPGPGAHRFS